MQLASVESNGDSQAQFSPAVTATSLSITVPDESSAPSHALSVSDSLPPLPSSSSVPSSSSPPRLTLLSALSFACLGFAPAYLLPTSLFMQIPYYKSVYRDWTELPAQLNVAVNLGTGKHENTNANMEMKIETSDTGRR